MVRAFQEEELGENVEDLGPQWIALQFPFSTIHGHTEDRHPLGKWRKKMEINIEKRNSLKVLGIVKRNSKLPVTKCIKVNYDNIIAHVSGSF